MMVNIKGLNPAKVIQALYAEALSPGLGMLLREDGDLAYTEADALVGRDIDYYRGRVMKVRVALPSFDASRYDRDNGEGAAQSIVDGLRRKSKPQKALKGGLG